MKILIVNKFYDLRGGTERVMFDLRDGLAARGHELIPFSMQDERNEASEWSRFFVPSRDYDAPGLGTKLRQARLTIYDSQARRCLENLLDELRPDLAHLHNIYHQLSPSILQPLRRRGIPVVMTLHDFKLACPSYTLFRDGKPCQKCVKLKLPFWCAVHCCSRGSRAESIILSIESSVHRMQRVYEQGVDRFICPSRTMAEVMRKRGIPAAKLTVIPNAPREIGQAANWSERSEEPSVLCAGRLSREKGVDVLVEAARKTPGIRIRIAGDGPLAESLRERARGLPWVQFLGRLSSEELRSERARAWLCAVPSICTENAPLTVLESYASGRGALVSDRGGLKELVDETTGSRIEAGNPEAWHAALAAMVQQEEIWEARGKAARRRLERDYSFEQVLSAHESLFEELSGGSA
ncbi:MAG TPA: glycosyltransferase [Candidatus Krumholzibacteria bacterium]|nr:glycosyltransferase [Candidatus Krumholzibacteria bacterium]